MEVVQLGRFGDRYDWILERAYSLEGHEDEVAVDQAVRELSTRFDFRGVDAGIGYEGEEILVWAEEEFQVDQLTDGLKEKLARRKVDIGTYVYNNP